MREVDEAEAADCGILVRAHAEVLDDVRDKVGVVVCAKAVVKVESWEGGLDKVAEESGLLVDVRFTDQRRGDGFI